MAAVVVSTLAGAPTSVAEEGQEAALSGVVAVSAGPASTCAVLASGQARCWGNNFSGELGDGNLGVDSAVPVAVRNPADTANLTGVATLSVGDAHACAVLRSGRVLCWGDNFNGQLGDGTTDDRALPVVVRNPADTGPLRGAVSVSAGDNHSCAVVTGGRARCWGDNISGQVGNGAQPADALTAQPVRNPDDTAALTGVAEVGAGSQFTCARLSSGQVRCWGGSASGRLGNNTTAPARDLPVTVVGVRSGALGAVRGLGIGGNHACAALADRRTVCWGGNAQGQQGDGTTTDNLRPAVVASATGDGDLTGVLRVSGARLGTSCGVTASGQVRCWGDGSDGQLGIGVVGDRLFPVTMRNPSDTGPLRNVLAVAAGSEHTCVLLGSGQLRCMGDDTDGQLGNGAVLGDQPLPTVVLAG